MQQNKEIWEFLPLGKFSLPQSETATALRGVRRLWKSLRAAIEGETEERVDYERAQTDHLEDVLPSIDLEAAADALAAALEGWPTGHAGEDATRVIVGPPGSNIGEVVAILARREGWAVLEAPDRARLAQGETGDLALPSRQADADRPEVIPHFEHWLLRTERGLPALRSWITELRRRGGPLIVGCDSWAWAFLDSTLGVGDLTRQPLTLAALDGARLEEWLGSPLLEHGRVCRSAERIEELVFRQPGEAPQEEEQKISTTLDRLAGASRGNPGVALELWRRCLRVTRDGSSAAEVESHTRVLWAASVHESEIVPPHELESVHEFILHATLIHGGLKESLLEEVLPFARHEIARRTRDLVNKGFLAVSEDEFRVPLAAYTAVREYLRSEGFLVDGF